MLDQPAYHERAVGAVRRGIPLRQDLAQSTARKLPCDAARAISAILEAVGEPWFYQTLSAQLASLLGCDRYLAMRYSRFAKPVFLVNNFMHGKVEGFYLDKLYLLDPLFTMAREGRHCAVTTLHGAVGAGSEEYRRALFHRASIADELALVLPMLDGVFIAICLDKQPGSGLFDGVSVSLARDLHPIVRRANLLHLERSLPGRDFRLLEDTATPVLVTTADHQLVSKNEAWSQVERSALRGQLQRIMHLGCVGKNVHLGEKLVRGYRLGIDHPIWSNGHLFFIEPQSAKSTAVNFDDILGMVADRYRLSPRERDLLRMALDGCGTRLIAEGLGLRVGTIKNYKMRLYAKLGIRSEREMASLLIGFLGNGSGAA